MGLLIVPPKSAAQLQVRKSRLLGPEVRICPKDQRQSSLLFLDPAAHRATCSPSPPALFCSPLPHSDSGHPLQVPVPVSQGWPCLYAQEARHKGQFMSMHWPLPTIWCKCALQHICNPTGQAQGICASPSRVWNCTLNMLAYMCMKTDGWGEKLFL